MFAHGDKKKEKGPERRWRLKGARKN